MAEHPAPAPAKEAAAAKTAFIIIGRSASTPPSPAGLAVVMPLLAAPMIVIMMTSKHEI
jgi:hypothetical protein